MSATIYTPDDWQKSRSILVAEVNALKEALQLSRLREQESLSEMLRKDSRIAGLEAMSKSVCFAGRKLYMYQLERQVDSETQSNNELREEVDVLFSANESLNALLVDLSTRAQTVDSLDDELRRANNRIEHLELELATALGRGDSLEIENVSLRNTETHRVSEIERMRKCHEEAIAKLVVSLHDRSADATLRAEIDTLESAKSQLLRQLEQQECKCMQLSHESFKAVETITQLSDEIKVLNDHVSAISAENIRMCSGLQVQVRDFEIQEARRKLEIEMTLNEKYDLESKYVALKQALQDQVTKNAELDSLCVDIIKLKQENSKLKQIISVLMREKRC